MPISWHLKKTENTFVLMAKDCEEVSEKACLTFICFLLLNLLSGLFWRITDKDSEIPALATFFESMDLKDVIVTADAMHCQKKL